MTAQPNRLHAEDVVRAEHLPFGVQSTFVPIGSVLSFDSDVMADHVMRSGAYLVQRGPICFESLLDFTLQWELGSWIGLGIGDRGLRRDVTHW
jgi:hypothetical protein